MNFKNFKIIPLFIFGIGFSVQSVHAYNNADFNDAFDFWATDSWNEFDYQSNTGNLIDGFGDVGNTGSPDGIVGPGGGGQQFDTEYLFYKYNADTNDLSIGLQTGFDIVDGKTRYNSRSYYAGDLALSFDGDVILGDDNESDYGNTYEYAVDFGLFTKNGRGNTVESMDSNGNLDNGIDPAGLYRVARWDNDIWEDHSSPFAMDWSDDEAYAVTDLSDNTAGSGYLNQTASGYNGTNLSYWRTVTFSLDGIISEGEEFTVDAHWTMSCGNDNINGSVQLASNTPGTPVPEPSIFALFTIGSLGLFFSNLRRRKLTGKFIA